GKMLEENLRRALVISQGDPIVFLERPISLAFLVLTVLLVLVLCAPMVRSKRTDVFTEEAN
ncbi:MAG: tripartite tricarboxylate transporter permease, partial [Pseudaminobacter sp.]